VFGRNPEFIGTRKSRFLTRAARVFGMTNNKME
jgi:hypothetical protein